MSWTPQPSVIANNGNISTATLLSAVSTGNVVSPFDLAGCVISIGGTNVYEIWMGTNTLADGFVGALILMNGTNGGLSSNLASLAGAGIGNADEKSAKAGLQSTGGYMVSGTGTGELSVTGAGLLGGGQTFSTTGSVGSVTGNIGGTLTNVVNANLTQVNGQAFSGTNVPSLGSGSNVNAIQFGGSNVTYLPPTAAQIAFQCATNTASLSGSNQAALTAAAALNNGSAQVTLAPGQNISLGTNTVNTGTNTVLLTPGTGAGQIILNAGQVSVTGSSQGGIELIINNNA